MAKKKAKKRRHKNEGKRKPEPARSSGAPCPRGNGANASANTAEEKMTLKDYHELAERRIGEYDGYAVRYKQWLAPVVSGFVLAAYFTRGYVGWLIALGILIVFLLFLVEMTIRSVNARFISYAKRLERLMGHGNAPARWDARKYGFGHSMKAKPGKTWKAWCDAICDSVRRVGAIFPYVVAAVILGLGVWLASELEPKSAPKPRTSTTEQILNSRRMIHNFQPGPKPKGRESLKTYAN